LGAIATKITLTVPPIDVVNVDHVFEVRQGTALVGRLKVSRGGLDWYRANARRRTGRATWQQLKKWMEG
jgi:hypothetical protein